MESASEIGLGVFFAVFAKITPTPISRIRSEVDKASEEKPILCSPNKLLHYFATIHSKPFHHSGLNGYLNSQICYGC